MTKEGKKDRKTELLLTSKNSSLIARSRPMREAISERRSSTTTTATGLSKPEFSKDTTRVSDSYPVVTLLSYFFAPPVFARAKSEGERTIRSDWYESDHVYGNQTTRCWKSTLFQKYRILVCLKKAVKWLSSYCMHFLFPDTFEEQMICLVEMEFPTLLLFI